MYYLSIENNPEVYDFLVNPSCPAYSIEAQRNWLKLAIEKTANIAFPIIKEYKNCIQVEITWKNKTFTADFYPQYSKGEYAVYQDEEPMCNPGGGPYNPSDNI